LNIVYIEQYDDVHYGSYCREDFMTLVWICLGSIAGTLLRFASSLAFNAFVPSIPMGTLLVNLVGGFLMGIMMGLALNNIAIAESIRLGIIVGFLGSLTTFSSFSGEVMALLISEQYINSFALIVLHVCGSLVMTYGGIYLVNVFVRA
jgi:CrcB protein